MTRLKAVGAGSAYEAVASDVYFGEAPPDTAIKMPYIVFFIVSDRPEHVFRYDDGMDDAMVQFSIFDDRPSIANISGVYDKLVSDMDRAALSYDSRSAVCCVREGQTGPDRLEDCWQKTVTYRIIRR